MRKTNLWLIIGMLFPAITCWGAPELYWPPDDSRFGANSNFVIFEWENIQSDQYQIELAIDDMFDIGTGPLNVGSDTFFNMSDLIPDDIWFPLTVSLFWRVRATDDNGVPGGWSDSFRFHKTTLSGPEIITGRDGRYNHNTDMPVLIWNNTDNMQSFRVEFAMDDAFVDTFGQIPVFQTELDLSISDRTVWDMLEDVFYWRVSAMTDCQTPGPWSEPGRLSKTVSLPPAPISPDDGAVYRHDSDPPVLEWSPGEASEPFQLRLFFDREGKYELITLNSENNVRFDFREDLGITNELWQYVPLSFFWGVAGFDSDGRAGVFSSPRELIKPGYQRVAAYGDSITEGKCFDNGYVNILHDKLIGVWGDKTTSVNVAVPGMKSRWGAENINERLRMSNPQFVLIMFGTNDSVDPGNCDPPFECDVAGHLAEMIEIARNRGSIPIISTIIPVNPEGRLADAQPRIDSNNQSIVEMAQQMHVELVDLDAMFRDNGNLPDLFCDWGHPNEEGYRIMADGFFDGVMNVYWN
jgi:lysophospholipase L1-like esterase